MPSPAASAVECAPGDGEPGPGRQPGRAVQRAHEQVVQPAGALLRAQGADPPDGLEDEGQREADRQQADEALDGRGQVDAELLEGAPVVVVGLEQAGHRADQRAHDHAHQRRAQHPRRQHARPEPPGEAELAAQQGRPRSAPVPPGQPRRAVVAPAPLGRRQADQRDGDQEQRQQARPPVAGERLEPVQPPERREGQQPRRRVVAVAEHPQDEAQPEQQAAGADGPPPHVEQLRRERPEPHGRRPDAGQPGTEQQRPDRGEPEQEQHQRDHRAVRGDDREQHADLHEQQPDGGDGSGQHHLRAAAVLLGPQQPGGRQQRPDADDEREEPPGVPDDEAARGVDGARDALQRPDRGGVRQRGELLAGLLVGVGLLVADHLHQGVERAGEAEQQPPSADQPQRQPDERAHPCSP